MMLNSLTRAQMEPGRTRRESKPWSVCDRFKALLGEGTAFKPDLEGWTKTLHVFSGLRVKIYPRRTWGMGTSTNGTVCTSRQNSCWSDIFRLPQVSLKKIVTFLRFQVSGIGITTLLNPLLFCTANNQSVILEKLALFKNTRAWI